MRKWYPISHPGPYPVPSFYSLLSCLILCESVPSMEWMAREHFPNRLTNVFTRQSSMGSLPLTLCGGQLANFVSIDFLLRLYFLTIFYWKFTNSLCRETNTNLICNSGLEVFGAQKGRVAVTILCRHACSLQSIQSLPLSNTNSPNSSKFIFCLYM